MAGHAIDPLDHFVATGWREGRNPTAWFDTEFYLRANPDVAAATINPFWHFLAAGRREGRAPSGRPDPRADQLARVLREPAPCPPAPCAPAPPTTAQGAPPDELQYLLEAACAQHRGIVLAVGHDDYAVAVGGTQIVTALEQQAFAAGGFAYLHVSPARPPLSLAMGLGLAAAGPAPVPVALRLDGMALGRTTWAGLRMALASLARRGPRLLVIHSLLGHRPEDIAQLADSFRPQRSVFWVHDYATVCGGLQLLRNDTWSCGAPPRDSMACRICRHGPSRPDLRARLHRLFSRIGFEVLAPSSTALAIWTRAADLPWRTARVHPHAELTFFGGGVAPRRPGKPRLAFVGQAIFHKGWPLFEQFVASARGAVHAELFHLAAEHPERRDGVTNVTCAVSPADPDATVRALTERAIDAVLVLSPWPETFCLVAHEALAAGARVVCLAESGHVAELVRRTGAGIILQDETALPWLLASEEARARLIAPPGARDRWVMRRSGGAADVLLSETGAAAAPAA